MDVKDVDEMIGWDKRITIIDQVPYFKNIPRNPAWGEEIRRQMDSNDRLRVFKIMRTLWVAAVAGGPFDYTGKSLDDAHFNFRIKPEEFDEVAAELRRALEYYKVPEREKEEAMSAFIAHKDEVTTGFRLSKKE
jgi:globin